MATQKEGSRKLEERLPSALVQMLSPRTVEHLNASESFVFTRNEVLSLSAKIAELVNPLGPPLGDSNDTSLCSRKTSPPDLGGES